MRKFTIFSVLALVSLLFFGCPLPEENTTLHISYTANGTAVNMTIGLDETGGKPHGAYDGATTTEMLASTTACNVATPPDQYVIIAFSGNATGSGIAGTLTYIDTLNAANNYSDVLSVTVTEYGSDGGIIAGTFAGLGLGGVTIASGSFRVTRNDAYFL